MRFFKNVNITITTANGNPSSKRFAVIKTELVNGFAIDSEKATKYFDKDFLFVARKLKSGKYYPGINGKEITERSFKMADKKRTKQIAAEILAKLEELEIAGKLANEKKEALFLEMKAKALTIQDEVAKFNLSSSENQAQWHDSANRIVGLLGFEYVNTFGWKTVLNVALNK